MLNISDLTSHCVTEIGHSFYVRFSNLKTNKERVDYLSIKINEHPDIRKKLDVVADCPDGDKSLDSALRCKQLGTKLFQAKKYREGIEKYNEGLMLAPGPKTKCNKSEEEGKEFSILLANRSACLFHCNEYEKSLQDIDASLYYGYPKNLAYKIMHRGGKCLYNVQKYQQAREYYNTGLNALNTYAQLDEKMKKKWIKTFEDDASVAKKALDASTSSDVDFQKDFDSLTLTERHESISSFSSALSLGYSEQCGRYVSAKQNVNCGDIVAIETPYSCVLLPSYNKTHCSECCKRVSTLPYPCQQCRNVVYCSHTCQEKSWESYHKFECSVINHFNPETCARVGHLAARTFIQGRNDIVEAYKKLRENNTAKLEQVKNNTSYNAVENLEGHEGGNRDGHTNLHLTLLAIFLKNLIYETELFEDPDMDLKLTKHDTKSFDSFVASTLIRLIQIIQCNTFTVPEMQFVGDIKHSSPEDIAMAIYPQMAFFNHSCDPDLELCFRGNKITTYAIKDVKKGDQVCVDYGYVFYSDSRGKRRSELKMQYLFDCDCVACAKHWPLFEGLDSQVPTFKCTKCQQPLDMTKQDAGFLICNNPCCDHREDLQQTLTTLSNTHKDYAEAMGILESEGENIYQRSLPILLRHLSVMGKCICPPWQEFYSCQSDDMEFLSDDTGEERDNPSI